MRFRRSSVSLFLIALMLLVSNIYHQTVGALLAATEVVPMSTQKTLAMAAVPALDPMPVGEALNTAYAQAFDLAYSAGARGAELDKTWKDLEPMPGKFNLDELDFATNYMANTHSLDLLLNLQLINTVSREMPSDLQNLPFDSAIMQNRFHALIDAIAPHINSHYRYISIGNEVDVYLSIHSEWKAYQAFYKDCVAYVHKILPWIKVGVSSTFDGATQKSPTEIALLNTSSDVYIVTYYPVDTDFVVRPPESPQSDFPRVLHLAGSRPLIMQEVGYPTSEALASSEKQQAEFVKHVFSAWASAGNKIPWLNYYMLHDLPAQTCNDLTKYYQAPNAKHFNAYLCSLGLRRADGTPKIAWQAFLDSSARVP